MRKEIDLTRRDERETCFKQAGEADVKYGRTKRAEPQ